MIWHSLPPREGVLDDMAAAGVECCDCISVDNALVRIGDPLFAGYCADQGAQCGVCPLQCPVPGRSLVVVTRAHQCVSLNLQHSMLCYRVQFVASV